MPPWAIVRSVPASFARALCAAPPDPPIDVDRARAQHAAYVAALAATGADIVIVASDEDCPDCCFVEDVAVLIGDAALVTRPGAPSRRAETDPVAAVLAGRALLLRMEAPATLDGGDCLRLGRTFYVGLSARSNRAGIESLAAAAAPRGFTVVPLDMPPGVLHLKSVCSPLTDDTLLIAENTLAPRAFAGARALIAPASETHASNAVATGDTVLVAAGAPVTRALVEATGLRTVEVDTSELRKADGALTCLSIVSG
ncbi:MAG TPA: arginine deiminase family protein [Kofleriaceae bacterium]|nr:arginine deiminase family protein [Kofleriaceae bacterium]